MFMTNYIFAEEGEPQLQKSVSHESYQSFVVTFVYVGVIQSIKGIVA